MEPTENREILKRPLTSIGYSSGVFICVFFNLIMMLIAFVNLSPLRYPGDTSRYNWFMFSVWFIVPVGGSFLLCLVLSLMTPRRITISPVYVTFFTFIPASLLGAYVEHSYALLPSMRVQLVINFLFSTSVLYIFLLFFSLVLHRIVRGLIGAFAERDNIRSGIEIYGTSSLLENILLKIDDRKWLSDLCAMRVVERKEEENGIRLKLNKHETNYYLSIYSEMNDSKVLFSLTPYELDENLAEKNIIVSEDCKLSLRHQIEEMKESFELKEIPESESSRILRDSLNYAMSPARFPMIYRYRFQFSAIVVAFVLSVLSISAYHTGVISLEILIGIIAIIVAITSTAINLLSRK